MNTLTSSIVNGGSVSAAVLKANTKLGRQDLCDALDLAGYGWAVQTRYIGATNTRGSRVSAGFAGDTVGANRAGKKTTGFDHELGCLENHLNAAMVFLNSLDNGCSEYKLVAVFSCTKGGYVFTFR